MAVFLMMGVEPAEHVLFSKDALPANCGELGRMWSKVRFKGERKDFRTNSERLEIQALLAKKFVKNEEILLDLLT